MLADTHSHIYSEEFDADREQVIQRAEAAGVGLILLPAIDPESHSRQEELATSRPDLFRQMMGLHPTSVDDNFIDSLAITKKLLFDSPDKYVGIGEIGLDFYWDTTFKEQQIDVVSQQIAWADQLDKPFVLHLRNGADGSADTNAYHTMFQLLQNYGKERYRGIMHCFSGTFDDALKAVEMGFLLGIGGVVTYKKSTLPDIVRALPLDKIVLETDSPYLAPVPYRGKRNESSYVALVAEKIAEIKECSLQQVADVTTRNTTLLFDVFSAKQ